MALVCFLDLCAGTGATGASKAPVRSHAQALGPWQVQAYEVTLHPTSAGLEAEFHGGIDWPNLILSTPPQGPGMNTLVLPVSNRSAQVAELFLRLGDDPNASWPAHAVAASVRLYPGQHTTILLPMTVHDARQLGMQVGPPPLGAPAGDVVRLDQPTGQVAADGVRTLVLTLWGQTGARQLSFGVPRLMALGWDGDTTRALIDRYGQSTRANWPDRISTDDALRRLSNRADPPWPNRSQLDDYGGVLAQGDAPGTGFFRIGHDSHGYFLLTPAGHRFFSLGINTVASSSAATYVSGREAMFRDLDSAPLAQHSGSGDDRSINLASSHMAFDYGQWVNFYEANLERRFGPDGMSAWRQETLLRLRSWGINTLGNWSDPALWHAPHGLPYVVPVALEGEVGHVTSAFDYWGPIADPFDARFAAVLAHSISQATQTSRDDARAIGDFVENELPWGDASDARPTHRFALAVATFALGPTSAAKRALVEQLKGRYDTIDQFNQAWHVHAESWEQLSSHPPPLNDALPSEALDDLHQFSQAFAERYYSQVAAAVRERDPHHLYLGSRFAALTPEALAACVKWCDVVSINLYSPTFDLQRLGPIDKPILISEFSFGSQDRGPFFAGVVDVGSEAERGRAYSRFVSAAAHDPRVVGTHWFEYLDEPASGRRLDGENGHFGVVAITDVPYLGLVQAMRAVHLDIEQRLSKAQGQK